MTPKVAAHFLALVVAATAAAPAHGRQLVQPPPPPTGQPPGTVSGEQPPVIPPRRPYRGLFGGSEANVGFEGLSLNLSGFGGVDDNVVAEQPGSIGSETPVEGYYAGMTGSLMYAVRGERASLTVLGTSQLRVYNDDVAPTGTTQSVLLTAVVPLARRVTLTIQPGVSYSPYYQFALLPDLPSQDAPDVIESPPLDVDQSVNAEPWWLYTMSADARQTLGQGSALLYEYRLRVNDFDESADDRFGQRAGVRFTRRMTRYATLGLGYTYEEGESEGGLNRSQFHNVNIGGNYARPLSFSRRTTVGFTGGTAVIQSQSRGNLFRVVGDGLVHHEIGRSWLARFIFSQNVRYVDVLSDPIYGFTTRGSVGGLVNPRVELTFGGGYMTGAVESGRPDASYSTASGTARIRIALTDTLALFGEYAYYDYQFGRGAGLPSDIPYDFQRRTVRTGMTLWLPIYTPRHTNATR